MSFSGFSEDDIRKLTKPNDINTNKPQQKDCHHKITKKVAFKSNSKVSRISKSKNLNNNVNNSSSLQEVPENAKVNVTNKSINAGETLPPKDESSEKKVVKELNELSPERPNQENKPVKENKKCIDLDEFEARQKRIEEQNRKRKELLAKALADRTKQTREEAQRLNEIQDEFKKLDAVLSCDVKILRKQIELASIDYMECQKRYTKIEKEFLEAKLLLHQKQEKKELLTEHLCAIIEKNEERKAEKLNELLQKLQLAPPSDTSTETSDTTVEASVAIPNK